MRCLKGVLNDHSLICAVYRPIEALRRLHLEPRCNLAVAVKSHLDYAASLLFGQEESFYPQLSDWFLLTSFMRSHIVARARQEV
jgi:hypothetical protein